MKIVNRLLSILFLFSLSSCRTLMPGHTDTYELTNNTPYELEVKGYLNFFDVESSAKKYIESDVIYISPNSKAEFDRERGEGSDDRTFFSIHPVDSVRVIFDSEKVLIYTCKDLTDNTCPDILKGAFVVTITEEDYENAIPIE